MFGLIQTFTPHIRLFAKGNHKILGATSEPLVQVSLCINIDVYFLRTVLTLWSISYCVDESTDLLPADHQENVKKKILQAAS